MTKDRFDMSNVRIFREVEKKQEGSNMTDGFVAYTISQCPRYDRIKVVKMPRKKGPYRLY